MALRDLLKQAGDALGVEYDPNAKTLRPAPRQPVRREATADEVLQEGPGFRMTRRTTVPVRETPQGDLELEEPIVRVQPELPRETRQQQRRPQEPWYQNADAQGNGPDWNQLYDTDEDYAYWLFDSCKRLGLNPHGPLAAMLDVTVREIREAQKASEHRQQQRQPQPRQDQRQPVREPRRDTRQPVEPPVQQARPVQAAPAPTPRPQEFPGRITHRYTADEQQLIREQTTLSPGDMGIPLYDCGRCGQPIDVDDKKCPHCGADLTKAQTPIEDDVVIELPGPAEEKASLGPEAAAAFSERFGEDNVRTDRPRGKRRRRQENEDNIPEFLKRAGRSN